MVDQTRRCAGERRVAFIDGLDCPLVFGFAAGCLPTRAVPWGRASRCGRLGLDGFAEAVLPRPERRADRQQQPEIGLRGYFSEIDAKSADIEGRRPIPMIKFGDAQRHPVRLEICNGHRVKESSAGFSRRPLHRLSESRASPQPSLPRTRSCGSWPGLAQLDGLPALRVK